MNLQLSSLEIEEFQESDLPIRVDIIDWALLQPEFKAVIERKYEVIQKAM